ncbi:signal peptidase I [Caenispirillum bisanense]|uniref:Signal peptidase I n=1 Tax=Caenispirillum bisanense TaxID=414052 RepID=A0A286GFP3_9PROT|nr:signal peptidase I [Caenispirillum bisanense]SOD94341.1 signal peptidase I Serine peptidase. MEROPS family S26A [Caenispirillum bisanense]
MFSEKKKSGGFGETIRTVIYAVLIAVVVRTVAFEPFNIPSGSMIPSLLIGDYLFVSKYSYGYSRYSFPFGMPPFDGRVLADEPQRGDVAVFKFPRDNKTDYIKRVVGLPGDRIQMQAGRLVINGEVVPRERIEDYVERDPLGNTRRFAQYIETLPGGTQHRIIEMGDDRMSDDTREFVVPDGHYFMMGDNRDNSDDSRGNVGFVPFENFVGRAEVLFFSTDGTARIWELWKWPGSIRWSRFFDAVG